jgi:glycosyltransferase involved in cell wall biosynthesis
MGTDQKISVCHLASGDLWAGAEVQMFTLLQALRDEKTLELSAIILNPGKLSEQLKNIGIEVTVLDENRDNFFQLRRKMIGILRGRNIDIIHSHRYKENILAALVKNRCGIKRLIQTIHGISEPGRGFAMYKARAYAVANRAFSKRYFDRIITVSGDIERRLQKKLPASRLITIHNAIDPQAVKVRKTADEIRREFNIDGQAPIIGATGRMVAVKAYDLFLETARLILEKRPDTRFMLVGDGPLRESLQELSRRLNIADKVIFPGFREDIIDIMNAFDLFMVSSFHEGVPMALLEAMSLKKAIVSTAVGGINEVIEDGVSGLLVEPSSVDALAGACLRIIEDASLKRELEIAAAKRIEEQFAIDILRKRVMSLYKAAVHSP